MVMKRRGSGLTNTALTQLSRYSHSMSLWSILGGKGESLYQVTALLVQVAGLLCE